MASARMAFAVRRYHTWAVHQTQTIADHVGNMLRIYAQIFGTPSGVVVVYIIWHDAGELRVGDLPFPVKANNPLLKQEVERVEGLGVAQVGGHSVELHAGEKNRVKVCDLLDMYEFGLIELALGNTFAAPIVKDTRLAVEALLKNFSSRADSEAVEAYVNRVTKQLTPRA